MALDYLAITIVVLLAITLVVVLIRKNKRDLKEFERKLNRDYHHPSATEHDNNDLEDIKSS